METNPAAMFVSHKLSPSKKTFQKPNILRRKPKAPSIKVSPYKPSLAPPVSVVSSKHNLAEPAVKHAWGSPETTQGAVLEPPQEVVGTPGPPSTLVEDVTAVLYVKPAVEESALVDGMTKVEPVNVEAFLNSGHSSQYKAKYEVHTKLENVSHLKWPGDFENPPDNMLVEPYPAAASARAGRAAPAEYKCGEAACGAVFASARALRRHAGAHGAGGGEASRGRAGRACACACPARGCARQFGARDALAAHLRDDHSPDDAPHRCGECGRRFFWAVGLRAHARAHVARGAPLACAWPGCARQFRQPCRLREHARAHTGDRPYRCAHPGCAWAFRTASKLLRHARRHTGERRHRCLCGRAFRRREHLRDHQARHHPQCGEAPEIVTTAEGDAVVTAGAAGAGEGTAGAGAGAAAPTPDAAGDAFAAGAGVGAGRAARTHCPWPLARRAPHAQCGAGGGACAAADGRACACACVGACACACAGAGAVRSDLFLAAAGGDDSQQLMAGAAGGAGAEAALEAASPPPPLPLLDLMQEELMYADAVDGSSFQVLLLSEELG